MTCIVGIRDNGIIYMGADSAEVAGDEIQRRADNKVFIHNNFIIGFTASFRMGQLLKYNFHPPVWERSQEMFAYMVTNFINAVRTCLKEGGYTKIENNEESGGTFLVGHVGRLFTIETDFQVSEMIFPYAAIGCGGAYALGSLYSTTDSVISPTERLMQALHAAAEFSIGVRGPFNIMEL